MRRFRFESVLAPLTAIVLFVILQMSVAHSRTRRLADAARNGNLEEARLLIAKGANVNGLDHEGDPVLMTAVRFNQPLLVRLLEKSGAQADPKTALMAAALMGRPQIAEELLKTGLNVNAKDRDRDTALAYACQWGHIEVVKILIWHGADVNNRNLRGETPLNWVQQCDDPNKARIIAHLLHRAGAQ
jgi:ankyrin repeat protein